MEPTTTHLPPWLQRAMCAPGPTRVEFPDSGYVSVFPDQRRYTSNIRDWNHPSLWAAEAPGLNPLLEAATDPDGQPLDQLHWTLTLERVRSQPQDFEFQYCMVRLAGWPSLTHLPDDVLPTIARICALLARKPTTASLIPLTLGLPEQQVFPLIEALRLNGHVQLIGRHVAPASTGQQTAEPQTTSTSAEEARPAPNSLISKLWQRLALRPQG